MKLSSIGEFEFIRRFANAKSQQNLKAIIGIGDDCAVFPVTKNRSLLVTTDLLIEDVHFRQATITPKDLGYKSLAVNLSDIAAMGGSPLYAFLSIALPKDLSLSWVEAFFKGFHSLCSDYKVALLGGDTSATKGPIFINVALVGEAHPQKIKLRSMAKPGDIICVTDCLGDSGAGLLLLEKKRREKYFYLHHCRPRPYVKEGQWLAAQPGVHAMIDVSDSINSDLRHICESSQMQADVFLEKIPLSDAFKRKGLGIEFAVTAGEDYCLCVTIDPKTYPRIAQNFKKKFKRPLYAIGRIQEQKLVLGQSQKTWMSSGYDNPNITYFLNGRKTVLRKKGFSHF